MKIFSRGGLPPPPGSRFADTASTRRYAVRAQTARTKKSPRRPPTRKSRRADFLREKIGVPTSRAKKKIAFLTIFYGETVFCVFCLVFEELGFLGRHWQILHEISLRAIQFSSKSELSSGVFGHVKVYLHILCINCINRIDCIEFTST